MTIDPRSFSTAFHLSVELLLQLHREMSTGDPDGEPADGIRDAMDRPWYEMNDYERELVRGLSADLYSVGRPRPVGPEVRNDLVRSAIDALKNNECEELLLMLRKNEKALPADSVSFLRGMAWSFFGQYEIAIEFFQEATRISNYQWPPFIHGLLTALIAAGRTEQAFVVAERIATESDNPLMLLDAAEVFFVRSTEVEQAQSKLLLKKAIETAQRGLPLAKQAEQNDALINQRALIQLWLALFYIGLGDAEEAGRAVAEAHHLTPSNPTVLFVKEILTQKTRRESWDQGAGRVMARFRMPTSVSTLVPDLLTTYS